MSDETLETKSPLDRAIEKAGGVKNLAELLPNCTGPAVSQWKQNGVPVERAIQIEKATGIPRKELRPDIFGEAA